MPPYVQTTPRTGWVRSGVRAPESIADHMYRMSIMAMTMAGSAEYDQQRLVKLAIVHDLAEAIVGDIAPSDNVSKEEKQEREAAALEQIVDMLGSDTVAAQEIRALWCVHAHGEPCHQVGRTPCHAVRLYDPLECKWSLCAHCLCFAQSCR